MIEVITITQTILKGNRSLNVEIERSQILHVLDDDLENENTKPGNKFQIQPEQCCSDDPRVRRFFLLKISGYHRQVCSLRNEGFL